MGDEDRRRPSAPARFPHRLDDEAAGDEIADDARDTGRAQLEDAADIGAGMSLAVQDQPVDASAVPVMGKREVAFVDRQQGQGKLYSERLRSKLIIAFQPKLHKLDTRISEIS
jgi:hypothetical protein